MLIGGAASCELRLVTPPLCHTFASPLFRNPRAGRIRIDRRGTMQALSALSKPALERVKAAAMKNNGYQAEDQVQVVDQESKQSDPSSKHHNKYHTHHA